MKSYLARNISPPNLVPHPDDIYLNPETHDAIVDGPECDEDARRLEYLIRLRDFLYRVSAAVHGTKGFFIEIQRGRYQLANSNLFANAINTALPRRYRLDDSEAALMMMGMESKNRREHHKIMPAERKWLLENLPPDHPGVTSEKDKMLRLLIPALLSFGNRSGIGAWRKMLICSKTNFTLANKLDYVDYQY